MVARLILMAIGYALVLAMPGGLIAVGVWRAWGRERWHRYLEQREGKRRALAAHRQMACSFCLKTIDVATDCFEPAYGWYHHNCLKLLTD